MIEGQVDVYVQFSTKVKHVRNVNLHIIPALIHRVTYSAFLESYVPIVAALEERVITQQVYVLVSLTGLESIVLASIVRHHSILYVNSVLTQHVQSAWKVIMLVEMDSHVNHVPHMILDVVYVTIINV